MLTWVSVVFTKIHSLCQNFPNFFAMKKNLRSASKLILGLGISCTALIGTPQSANAAACGDFMTLQDLINGGGSCTQFGASGATTFTFLSSSGFNTSDVGFTSLGNGNTTATFGLASNSILWNTGTYTFNYTITHATKKLSSITNTLSGSANMNQNLGTYQVDSTLSAADLTANFNLGTITNGSYTYPSPTLSSDTFDTTLKITQGNIENFSATYMFADMTMPPSAVPGPLPIFGAGAAFAFSRRIRARISAKS
jgi:hypothetical protein